MARRNEKPAGSPAEAADRDVVAHWRRLVAEQLASGLSQDKFCEQRRVSPNQFRYWKYSRLALVDRGVGQNTSQAPAPATASLLPVRVVQGSPSASWGARSEEGGPSGVEVLLPGGLKVSLRRGFDGSVLREVLEVLGC